MLGCCRGGIILESKHTQQTCCNSCPIICGPNEEAVCFGLSVRVLSASIPALNAQDLMVQRRPRVEVELSGSQAETDFGTFVPARNYAGITSEIDAPDGQWCFDETLTFPATLTDLLSPGLHLRVCCRSDVILGPVLVALTDVKELGQLTISLRHRILPACLPKFTSEREGDELATECKVWETPILATTIEPRSEAVECLEEPSRIFVTCSVTMNPEKLMQMAEDSERSQFQRALGPCGRTLARQSAKDKANADDDPPLGKVLWPPRKPMRCAKPLGPSGFSPRASAWTHLTKVGSLRLPGITDRTVSNRDAASSDASSLLGGTVREYLWESSHTVSCQLPATAECMDEA